MASDLALGLMAVAMASAVALLAYAYAQTMRTTSALARTHREDLRTIANFAINANRVYANEFLRAAIRARVPEIDDRINSIHRAQGGDRADAVAAYLTSIETGEDPSNGESP